jgi:hypothetical protein
VTFRGYPTRADELDSIRVGAGEGEHPVPSARASLSLASLTSIIRLELWSCGGFNIKVEEAT